MTDHYDHYQIEIPDSFIALFLEPGGVKPSATRQAIAARYEVCEDLANQLHEYARARRDDLGISEAEVLSRCHLGLSGDASVVDSGEAIWVVRRLAELLDWRCPALDGSATERRLE